MPTGQLVAKSKDNILHVIFYGVYRIKPTNLAKNLYTHTATQFSEYLEVCRKQNLIFSMTHKIYFAVQLRGKNTVLWMFLCVCMCVAYPQGNFSTLMLKIFGVSFFFSVVLENLLFGRKHKKRKCFSLVATRIVFTQMRSINSFVLHFLSLFF